MIPFDLLAPEPAPRFGSPPRRNAFVELHNVIAAAETLDDFGPDALDRISRQHGVDLHTEFLAERVALYQRLLDHRLGDGDLSAQNRVTLAHVARTLALTPADLRASHERAFGKTVTEAIADDHLDHEERLLLYKLQHALGLDPPLAEGAYDVLARERLLVTVARVLADGELSPEEEAEVEQVRAALSLEIPEPVAVMLRSARQRWDTRNGEMPEVDADVTLLKDETAHVVMPARWRNVDGGALKAVSYAYRDALRTGRTQKLKVPEAVLFGRTETGRALVTDRRVVLLPDRGVPDDYTHRSLIQTLRFQNGVVLRTRGDRRVFVDVEGDLSAFYTVLYRAVHPEGAAPD